MKITKSHWIAITALLSAFSVLIFLKYQRIVPAEHLLRDLVTTTDSPFYYGFISSVGVLIWCVSGTVCLFSWLILRQQHDAAYISSFFLYSGVFSIILCLDDQFLIHEVIIRKYLHIPETVLFLAYIIYIGLWLITYRKIILKSSYPFLILAGVLFAVSLSIDFVAVRIPSVVDRILSVDRILYEDGAKFLAIVAWCGYFTMTAYTEVSHTLKKA